MEPGLPFFEKERKQRNFLRSSASPLCFKGQVQNLSLFVFPKPSSWGPTPLVKGRCPEGTEGIGTGAPVRTLGRMRGQVPAPSPVGAHIVRPLFFPTIPVGAGALTRPSCLSPGGKVPPNGADEGAGSRHPLCRARRLGAPPRLTTFLP